MEIEVTGVTRLLSTRTNPTRLKKIVQKRPQRSFLKVAQLRSKKFAKLARNLPHNQLFSTFNYLLLVPCSLHVIGILS